MAKCYQGLEFNNRIKVSLRPSIRINLYASVHQVITTEQRLFLRSNHVGIYYPYIAQMWGSTTSQGMSYGCRKTISRLLTRAIITVRALNTHRTPTRRTLLTPMIAHSIENTRTRKTRTRRTFSSLTDAQLVRSTQTISRGIKPWIHAHSAISIGFPRPVKTKCVRIQKLNSRQDYLLPVQTPTPTGARTSRTQTSNLQAMKVSLPILQLTY